MTFMRQQSGYCLFYLLDIEIPGSCLVVIVTRIIASVFKATDEDSNRNSSHSLEHIILPGVGWGKGGVFRCSTHKEETILSSFQLH